MRPGMPLPGARGASGEGAGTNVCAGLGTGLAEGEGLGTATTRGDMGEYVGVGE